MSKKTFKLFQVLALMIVMVLGSAVSVAAESYDYSKGNEDYHWYFTKDHKMVSNFDPDKIAKEVEQLQPGDDVTFKVIYKNTSDDKTDWYMENKIEKTLEETRDQVLAVEGVGTTEHGGYTYEVLHHDNDGREEVLFNSVGKKLGGDETVDGKEGLLPGTNALEDWFFIQTLEPGQQGDVVLKVAFEGETEVNDYMDTDGGLNVRFAVELPSEGNTPPPPVKTGDYTNIVRWVAILMASSVLLLIMAIISIKRDRKEAYDEKH